MQLSNYIKQVRGVSYKPSDISSIPLDGYIPLLRSNNICDGKINFDNLVYVAENKVKEDQVLKLNDILVCASSGSKELVGKAATFYSDKRYTFGAFCKVIRAKEINNEYLSTFFQSDYYRKSISQNSRGANINNLKHEDFDNLHIIVPSVTEQEKISNQFNLLFNMIECKKMQIFKMNQLIKSQFVEMFDNKDFKKEELIKLCKFIDYRGKTPTKCDDGIPLITAKNVRNNKFSFEPSEYFLNELYDSHMTRGIPKVGDVLFTTEAPLGNVCRIPDIEGKFAVGQRIITMQPYEKINEIYLEYVLLSYNVQKEIWKKSSGSTVKGIKSKLLELIMIPVPPIELQNKFAQIVEQIDKQKFEFEKSLKKLEELKASLMQEYFG